MDRELRERIQRHLAGFVTDRRKRRGEEVLEYRTRYITVVVENLFQQHNASAVIRTCDCFGIQDLHVIELDNLFEVNDRVAVGAEKWVNVRRHSRPDAEATRECLEGLKSKGYRVAALTLREGAMPLEDVMLDQKLALCLGTEEDGLTDTAHELADVFVRLPLYGFTQSFNVSVTAALCLSALTTRLHRTTGDWRLTEPEKDDLRYEWYCRSVPNADLHVARVMREASGSSKPSVH